MNEVIVLANTQPENKHQSGNVYSGGGIAPTIMAGTHGYGFGYVLEITELDVKNERAENDINF